MVGLLGELSAVVDRASVGSMSTAEDGELREIRREIEKARRRLEAVLARCLGECASRMESRGRSENSAAAELGKDLGLPTGTTRNLVGAGKRSGTLAMESLASGRITGVQEQVIARAAAELGESVEAEDRAEFERKLVALAEGGVGPGGLRNEAEKQLVRIDPERQDRKEEVQQRKRAAQVRAQGQDGMSGVNITCDPQLRALLDAVLAKWGQPGQCIAAVPDPVTGRMPDADELSASDSRSPSQRAHDAIKHAFSLAFEAVEGGSRGVASIVVTLTPEQLDEIEGGGGVVTTNCGTEMSARQAVSLAGRRSWFLSVLAEGRQELRRVDVDRSRGNRLASALQRLVLFAHYGGCTHPNCAVPAARCQAHHVIPYADGGDTTLANLCLACHTHHGWVGDGAGKWATLSDPERPGSPVWIPSATAELAADAAA